MPNSRHSLSRVLIPSILSSVLPTPYAIFVSFSLDPLFFFPRSFPIIPLPFLTGIPRA